MEFIERAHPIKLLALDIDGVMTDGGLHYSDDGLELKTFHVQDGLGIKLLQKTGMHIAIITGRDSPLVSRRADDLGIEFIYQGVSNKQRAMSDLRGRLGLDWSRCAFMGDDLIDLPALIKVGLAVAPANARPEVKERVHWITQAQGGKGAVRELAEALLKAQGHWPALLNHYLDLQ